MRAVISFDFFIQKMSFLSSNITSIAINCIVIFCHVSAHIKGFMETIMVSEFDNKRNISSNAHIVCTGQDLHSS